MADEALHYLLNKLKSDDGWSSASLAWNEDKVSIVADQFSSFDSNAKTKVLLSFLSMTPRTISRCSEEMQQILRLARRDGDEWVRLFARILAPFPHSQSISVDSCTEGGREEILVEVADALSPQTHHSFIPHEYAYLNHAVLRASHGYSVPTQHEHFVLRQKPQATVQLRNEMLHRASTDYSQTGSLVKDRHLLQRQLSSSATGSNPFVSTNPRTSTRKSIPIPGLSTRVQRERGTKLLDIDEVPVTSRRKRRTAADLDLGTRPDAKRLQRLPSKGEPDTPTKIPLTPVSATPDYAAGLGMGEYVGGALPEGEDYNGATSSVTSVSGAVGAMQIQPPANTDTPSLSSALLTPPPVPPSPGAEPPPPTPSATKQPAKGLKLSRGQLSIAQEMFKESPSLSREQKALILGFMAGSRDNPTPGRDIVRIKLNEKRSVEGFVSPEGQGSTRQVLVETAFEMNYSNGQWRKLQFKRTLPPT